MSVAEFFAAASPETRRLVTDLLEQDAADRAWGDQIGPSLTQADTARLLGKSEQAIAKDRRLLRLKTRLGRVAYPVLQFRGRAPLRGIAEVGDAALASDGISVTSEDPELPFVDLDATGL